MRNETRDHEPLATPDDVARAFLESGEPALLTWQGWRNLRRPQLQDRSDSLSRQTARGLIE